MKPSFKNIFVYLSLILICIGYYSCSELINNPIANQPPQTHVSLYPDSTIAPGSTLRRISWWGDDGDGFIVGYRISFDAVNWAFTTKQDSAFVLSIQGKDSTFNFFVAAVDDKGLVDPTPANMLYPTINTPPTMSFDASTGIPDTTYPVATFKWNGFDPDGIETIKSYYWSLNDTLNFKRIDGSISIMTLTADSGLALNARNILYMKAQDQAGAFSPVIKTPSDSSYWYVKQNTARILLIKDIASGNLPEANPYFTAAFDTIKYDVLDIKSRNGALIPKIINPMFIATLKLYKIVMWSSGSGSAATAANLDLAQQSLPFYVQAGGRVFFSSGFPSAAILGQGSIINFAPVDSITSCTIPFVLNSDNNLNNIDNNYPVIGPSSAIQFVRGMKVQSNIPVIYKFYKPSGCFDTITVAIKDVAVNPRVIYMTMPVFSLNNSPKNSKALFRRIFLQEFGY